MNPTSSVLQAVSVKGTNLPFPFNAQAAFQLPEDQDEAVDLTAAAMCAMIHHAAATSERVMVAAARCSMSRGWETEQERNSGRAALYQLWYWAKGAHKFTPDPLGQELLRHPDQLLLEAGDHGSWHADCDDLAMLIGAVVMRLGNKCRIVVIGREPAGPFEHVYIEACTPQGWLALDPQETERVFDQRPHARRREYPVYL